MDNSTSRKSNKIRDIVRLHQLLKKWKRLANNNTTTTNNNNASKSINKFLKKTLSFSENTVQEQSTVHVPKGYISVCVGKEMQRFMIPTEYLSHRAFAILLREAEEEFGFQQEGVLKFPCEVEVFENVLKVMGDKRYSSSSSSSSRAELCSNDDDDDVQEDRDYLGSVDLHRQNHHPQMCR